MPTAQRRLGPLKARRLTCQWNRSSPVGPALHDVGGSFWRSCRRAGQSRGNGGGGVGRGGESPAHRSADDVEGVWVNRWVRSELESREREGRRKARHRGTEGSCWERGGGGGGSQQVGLPSPSTPSRVLSDHGQGRRSNQEAEPCMACSPGGARDDRSGGPGRGQERDSGRGMGRRRQKFLHSPSPPPPPEGSPVPWVHAARISSQSQYSTRVMAPSFCAELTRGGTRETPMNCPSHTPAILSGFSFQPYSRGRPLGVPEGERCVEVPGDRSGDSRHGRFSRGNFRGASGLNITSRQKKLAVGK